MAAPGYSQVKRMIAKTGRQTLQAQIPKRPSATKYRNGEWGLGPSSGGSARHVAGSPVPLIDREQGGRAIGGCSDQLPT